MKGYIKILSESKTFCSFSTIVIGSLTGFALFLYGLEISTEHLLALLAFWLTHRESQKWRTELVGKKSVELAIEIGVAALKVQRAFRYARSPIIRSGEPSQDQRLNNIEDEMQSLYELRDQFEAVTGISIDEQVKSYNEKLRVLQNVISHRKRTPHLDSASIARLEKFEKIETSSLDDLDEFGIEIDHITENILELTRKYIE